MLADPVVVDRIVEGHDPRVRLLILGDDDTGRALEVIAVEGDDVLIVILAMDLRQKYRALYDEGRTPSGFELELCWSPLIVTPDLEAAWEPTTYQGISAWGHTPVGEDIVHKMGMVSQALRSIRERELTVPQLSERHAVPSVVPG